MFTTLVLKVTAWCNLNCTYCYMFNQADTTYARVPRELSSATSLTVLDRVRAHYLAHDLREFTIVLHGGEPTLWPDASLEVFLERVEALRLAGLNLRVELQTNALHVRPSTVRILRHYRVRVGVSVDGPKAVNDAHRVNHAGRGSYEQVMSTVDRLVRAGGPDLIRGFLCVADPDCDPTAFLAWADQLPIRRLDVLWPIEYSYDRPPWPAHGLAAYRQRPRYGEWFAELFRLWWKRDDPTLHIRLFEQCILWYLGGRQHADMIVNDHVDMLVINTDGGYEYPDYFRAYADGASRTAFNVLEHSIGDLHEDDGFRYCLTLGESLPPECADCDVVGLCGGGFLPGRMESATELPHRKSVLCFDQYRFFSEVAATVAPYVRHSRATDTQSSTSTSTSTSTSASRRPPRDERLRSNA
jgi:uncharacterized protein